MQERDAHCDYCSFANHFKHFCLLASHARYRHSLKIFERQLNMLEQPGFLSCPQAQALQNEKERHFLTKLFIQIATLSFYRRDNALQQMKNKRQQLN